MRLSFALDGDEAKAAVVALGVAELAKQRARLSALHAPLPDVQSYQLQPSYSFKRSNEDAIQSYMQPEARYTRGSFTSSDCMRHR